MKTVKIAKSNDFSSESRLILHLKQERIHIKGFGSYTFSLGYGESFYLTHQWTSSQIVSYDDLGEENFFLVKPRLDKRLLFIFFFVFMLCTIAFLVFRSRWSYLPLIPFVIYILLYLSVLRNKYLILTPVKNTLINKQEKK